MNLKETNNKIGPNYLVHKLTKFYLKDMTKSLINKGDQTVVTRMRYMGICK